MVPRLLLVLGTCLLLECPAAAGVPILSKLQLIPDPPEAYGRLTVRAAFSGAEAALKKLWVQFARDEGETSAVAYDINLPGADGMLSRSFELGQPGPRRLTLWVEDASGGASPPLETRFNVVAPSPPYEVVAYTSDGLRIRAYLYRPLDASMCPVIIYSHGSVERSGLSLARRFEWLGYRLARVGYAVLVAERRGYGGSEGAGVIGGEGLSALRYGLPGEVNDVLAAIDYLKTRPEVDGSRVALIGKSLGGLVSLLAAAERPGLRAVVSLAGGYGFGDRTMGPVMLFVQNELRDAARRIAVPTLLMHVQTDRVVPVSLSKMVAGELHERGVPVTEKIYPGFKVGRNEIEGHAMFDRVDGMPFFWKDLTTFLAAHLN